MTGFRGRWICEILIALGFVISFGVLWRQAVLTGLWPGGDTGLFVALFGRGHGEMLGSPVAVDFGLPLAAWSFIYYGTLAALLLLARFLGESFAFEAHLTAFLLSLPASLISLGLAGMTLTGPFCGLCTLAHVNNLALVYPLYRLTGRPMTQLFQPLAAGGRYLLTGKAADPVQAGWKLLGLLAVAMVALVLYQWVLIDVSPGRSINSPQQVLTKFESTEELDIPVGPDDPTLGPASAPVQLVVFSDFQCPTCDRYARQLHTMADQYGDKLQIVFKHFPLDQACNPGMKGELNLHPRACEAAYAAEAANKQGKFWPFHDKLFATNLRKKTTRLDSLAQASGLDLERFKADSLDISTMLKVHSDIALAGSLKIHGTPTLFLNRRAVSSIRPQDVRVLIYQLLQEAAHGH